MATLTALLGRAYLGGFGVAVVLLLIAFANARGSLSARDHLLVPPLMLACCVAWPVPFALWVRSRLNGSTAGLIDFVWRLVVRVGRVRFQRD
ncbi:MAG: hypothetical protein ABMA25_10140 [Ilumatobacteraceae bacterium]